MDPLPIYTVVPELLFAGAHPLWLLSSLVEHGIRSFIDLTEADELAVRSPRPHGYTPALVDLSKEHQVELERHSFPIEDFGVPTPELLDRILARIEMELALRRPVYVHCWGGYGRTGIVVGAWLIRHRRATPSDFVDVIARLRAHLPNHFQSPVTAEQVEFVRSYATDWDTAR